MQQFRYRPHHGVHLGLFRIGIGDHLFGGRYWHDYNEQYSDDQTFRELLRICSKGDREFASILQYL